MTQYRQNGRTGSFLAVNNGIVEGCIADITFSCKNVGVGICLSLAFTLRTDSDDNSVA